MKKLALLLTLIFGVGTNLCPKDRHPVRRLVKITFARNHLNRGNEIQNHSNEMRIDSGKKASVSELRSKVKKIETELKPELAPYGRQLQVKKFITSTEAEIAELDEKIEEREEALSKRKGIIIFGKGKRAKKGISREINFYQEERDAKSEKLEKVKKVNPLFKKYGSYNIEIMRTQNKIRRIYHIKNHSRRIYVRKNLSSLLETLLQAKLDTLEKLKEILIPTEESEK